MSLFFIIIIWYVGVAIFGALRGSFFQDKKKFHISKSIVMTIDTKKRSIHSVYDINYEERVHFQCQAQTREVFWIWYKFSYCLIESKEGILLVHRLTDKITEYANVDELPDKYGKFKEWRKKMMLLQEFFEAD